MGVGSIGVGARLVASADLTKEKVRPLENRSPVFSLHNSVQIQSHKETSP